MAKKLVVPPCLTHEPHFKRRFMINQARMRLSRIQTTLDLYTQEDSDEARGAQGEFLKEVGVHSGMTQ
jgi:hypothetical protein